MEDNKRKQIIEKIKKLLRLAKSSNEHEAALAAAKAQELLATYNLNEEDFSEREMPKEAGTAHTDTVKKPAGWVYILAAAVAGAFDSQYFHHPGQGLTVFVGVGIDHEVANFTFGYLYRSINKLAAKFMSKSQQRRLSTKGKRKSRLSFCLGATQVVALQLAMQKQVTPITTTALVPVKHALIVQKMETYGVRTDETDPEDVSERAYWIGRREGATIDHKRKAMPKGARPIGITA
uniref:Uncharacterized protein n=1 Tax=Geobacter sp. (strain M21) TaxID=443144 RepID=C6E6T3_GEOSM